MAQVFDLGNVLSTAENIQGARLQNQARQQTFDANVLAQDAAAQRNVLLQQYMADPRPENLNAIAASSPELASQIRGLELTDLDIESKQQGIDLATKENQVLEAKQTIKNANIILGSSSPLRMLQTIDPDFINNLADNGVKVEELTDDIVNNLMTNLISENQSLATFFDEPVVPLSPGGKVQRDVSLGFLTPEQAAEGTMTAFDQKVAALVRAGVPENIAIGIQAGQFVITVDPVSKQVIVVDISTGESVFDGNQPLGNLEPASIDPVIPLGSGVNVAQALGGSGTIKTGINKIVDLLGGDLPFEETSVATSLLKNINSQTVQLMRVGTDGKLNQQLQEKFDDLTVKPYEIFNGDQEAKDNFESLVGFIDAEANRLQKEIDSGKLAPATRDDARQRVSQARSLSSVYKEILTNLDQKEKGDIMRFFN